MGALDMLIDVVDPADRVIGTVQRRQVFQLGVNFRVAHVFLFNARKQLLLQRIAPGLRHSGMWGSSAAGYLGAGETYEQAARRKLSVELGVNNVQLDLVGKSSMIDGGATKFIALYDGSFEGVVTPDPAEVSEVEFADIATIAADRISGRRLFTPTFLHLLAFFQSAAQHP